MAHTLSEVILDLKGITTNGLWLVNGTDSDEFVPYGTLLEMAERALFTIQEHGIRSGEELVLHLDDNKQMIIVFWACILGGIIPVPVSIGRNPEHKRKLFLIWRKLNRPNMICSVDVLQGLRDFAHENKFQREYDLMEQNHIEAQSPMKSVKPGVYFPSKPNDIAFIQFSSGSTGNPKGVILTHENLLTNISAISKAAKYSRKDKLISWMPLTHDMGLIGFHLNPMFCGLDHFIIPTGLFVRKPAIWFNKVTEYGITVLGSPNFGFSYILKYCIDKEQFWDLSTVRVFYNGAEPISSRLCDTFLDQMVLYGLKRYSICPVYGLAEASLAVSMSGLEDEVIALFCDRHQLNLGDKVEIIKSNDQGIDIVNVGKSINDCSVQIMGENGNFEKDKVIGHILIRGKNVTKGYYNDRKSSEAAKGPDGWLKTGDLGFLLHGNLYVTGRSKDVLFINGQNFYPHDIERIAEDLPEIELNKIAVSGYSDKTQKGERIVAFVHHKGPLAKFVPLAKKLQEHISAIMGIELHEVLPVANIPRTTSGKLQRFKLIDWYLDGQYDSVKRELASCVQPMDLKINALGGKTEQRVASIWKNILKLKKIGPEQSFFALGGNSLKLAEMAMAIEHEFKVDIPFERLYALETISQISKELDRPVREKTQNIPKHKKTKYFPLSPSQIRLFYSWALDRESRAYNLPIAMEINGTMDIEKLQRSLDVLVARHPMLRMGVKSFSKPRLFFREPYSINMNKLSCTGHGLHMALSEQISPFNLFTDNLFRASLLQVDDGRTILFVDFHHIMMDGHSIHRFFEELNMLLGENPLAELSVDYQDFVYWQEGQLQNKNRFRSERYWLKTFEKGIPLLELPTDRPRKRIMSNKGAKHRFEIGKGLRKNLVAMAKQQQVTLHTLLFSLYKWFLVKLTGQHDIVIGIMASGRNHADLYPVLGMFANNLAMMTISSDRETFVGSLKRDNESLYKAIKNQNFPYHFLVEKLVTTRDVGRNPLFDTMFLFSEYDLTSPTKDFKFERSFLDPGISKFDLTLEVFDDSSLTCEFEYATDLFDKDSIHRFAGYFINLIKAVVSAPTSTFGNISMLTTGEFQENIESFNDTATHFEGVAGKSVPQLFEEQATKDPEKIALDFGDGSLSFREINTLAEQFRSKLVNSGVCKGDTVAVSLKRSPELIVSILGIFKAGAVYLPISTELPMERFEFIIKDSNSKILAHHPGDLRLGRLSLDKIPMELEQMVSVKSEPGMASILRPSDDAYMIYTSGTTGTPKGVVVPHGSLLNYVFWATKEYFDGEDAVFGLMTSIDFDLTLTSIFLPLTSGNRIVIGSEDSGNELMDLLRNDRVTHIKLTPSHLKMLINNRCAPSKNLRRVIVGGEQLTYDVAKRFASICEGEVVIYNEYGPTEATIGCMIHKFDPAETNRSVPIGTPIANSQVYLLDDGLKPVPNGVVGELFISGVCLAKGYRNQKGLTKKKFIKNPFKANHLMYRSGDLARKLPSGVLEYIGRKDEQLKIKGYRIEKDEIRAVLAQYPGMRDVVISTLENRSGELDLIAYYVYDKDLEAPFQESDLKSYLMERLPHYMIPMELIALSHIPVNKNGKIDHSALSALKIDKKVSEGSFDSPIYGLVLKAYQEVLGDIGNGSGGNFFERGGDSIKATQIVSKLYAENIHITPRDVLVYHSIEELARYIQVNATNRNMGLPAANPDPIGHKPGSPMESWFFGLELCNPNRFNQSVLLETVRNIKISAMERAFGILFDHHDGLRLTLDPETNTLLYNEGHLAIDFKIEEHQITAKDGLIDILDQVREGLDLLNGPLVKVALIRDNKDGPQKVNLFITAHHLLVDGVSWRILLEDLVNVYNAILEGKQPELAHKTSSLSTFRNGMEKYLLTIKLDRELEYWNSVAKVSFAIPLDLETEQWQIENQMRVAGFLDRSGTEWLLVRSAAHNLDINTILHLALLQVLASWTGSDVVKLELENHGRHLEHLDVSRTIGWFTTMFPAIFHLEHDLAKDIHGVREALRAIPNHGMGYGELALKGYPILKFGEMSEVRFNYLGHFGKELSNGLFTLSQKPIGKESDKNNAMTTKLEINAMVFQGQLYLDFLYNGKAHHKATIEGLKNNFFQKLSTLIDFLSIEDTYLLAPSDFDTVEITQEELDRLFE